MIYVHIPFCASKCHYCDFYSVASKGAVDGVLQAMEREIAQRAHEMQGVPSATLYLGGGTPSVLSIGQLTRLVEAIKANFDLSELSEFTIEANPEHLSAQYIYDLKELGVNRLSIGIQSFDDDHLLAMNRRHTSRDCLLAIETAQQAGFDNLSIDLIYGLPFMSDRQWIENVERAIGLGVQHISAYHLSIEERTVFGKQKLQPIDEQRSEWQYQMLCQKLQAAGFEHYEISNFAQPSRRSLHNSGYWRGVQYVGIGPSAHSFDGAKTRSWNVSSNKLYIENTPPESETLSDIDRHNEYLMIHLRTLAGVERVEYRQLFGRELNLGAPFEVTSSRVSIAERDWLISDSLIAPLFL